MPTAENNFFQKKHTTSVAYLVGLLLFFLPFVQIRCNDMPYADNTGLGLAFGTDYKVTAEKGALENGIDNKEKAGFNTSKEEGKMYVLALVALILGVIGLIISLSNSPFRAAMGMITGPLAALSLIIVMIQINRDVKTEVKEPDVSNAIKISVEYTLWFYLSVCSFLASAFFSYKHRQLTGRKADLFANGQEAQNTTEKTAITKVAGEAGN